VGTATATPSDVERIGAAPACEARDYLWQPSHLWPILATFPLITLPLAALAASSIPKDTQQIVFDAYLCVFGLTHFWVTFAIYLNGETLDHFRESRRNRWIYFYAPLAIFLFFALFFGTGLASTFPTAALLVLIAVRFVNYRHLTRQAYGVSRMLWSNRELAASANLPKAENGFLSALTMLMFLTAFYGGKFTLEPIAVKATLALASGFGLWVAAEYVKAAFATSRPTAVAVPATYLTLQVLSVALAVYRTELYVATLAMHYVEYHVLMAPRCFRLGIDPARQPDRFFATIRSNPAAFYAALLALSVAFLAAQKATISHAGTMVPHMFDALFVFHFFVECFVWKMGTPHYRRTLGPIYLASRAQRVPAAAA
jgi:hypothetical protein